jgi:hypothetical protein
MPYAPSRRNRKRERGRERERDVYMQTSKFRQEEVSFK